MSQGLRIGLISDTHGLLRSEVYAAFDGVDEILHAGDVGDEAILTELEVIAPVHAVYGNVDGLEIRAEAPETLELERLNHKIAVIHGHQWGSPKVSNLIEAYPGFSVIVYGHTHRQLIERAGETLVINPGSAGHRRFDNPVSTAILTLEAGKRPGARLIDL